MHPSPRRIADAYAELARTAQQLLAIDPNMSEDDQKLWQDMLEAESAGDPFHTLDRLVQAMILTEHNADGVKQYRAELSDRQDRLARSAQRLRVEVKRFLEGLEISSLVRPTYSASISAGRTHVVPTLEAKEMPPRFQRVTVDVNKEALKEALRAREENVPAEWSNPEPVLTIRVR